ncbi:MAG: HEAT repeat domain-containing protein, partial [Sedimentisphaerales bacterium]|nr:HEAT repeat domain-containing protein [Sedimentisphaerales bacterium]
MKMRFLFCCLICFFLFGNIVLADEEQDLIGVLQSHAAIPQKCNACLRLRIVGTARSVPALGALLGEEERLSHAARNALEGMPCPEAGKALCDALSASAGVRKAGLIDSLGWRREPQAVPLLKPLLSDSDTGIASAAASALGRIGGKEAADALSHGVGKAAPEAQITVLEGLLRCAERYQTSGKTSEATAVYSGLFHEQYPTRIRVAAWRGLVLSDMDRRKELVVEALRSTDRPVKRAALKLIRELGDEEILRICMHNWGTLPPESQLAVLDAHGKQGKSALEMTRTALGSQYLVIRVAALEAAGSVGDSSLVKNLAERAAYGTPAEKAAAQQSLSRLPDDEVGKAILAALDSSESDERVELIRALRVRKESAATDRLVKEARNDIPQVRQAAVEALGDLAGIRQIPALVDMAFETADPKESAYCMKALVLTARRNTAQDRTTELTLEKFDQAGPKEQLVWIDVLGQLGSKQAVAPLQKALRQTENADLRYAAIQAVGNWPDASFLGDLEAIARTSDNKVHRVLAVRGMIGLLDRSSLSAQEKLKQYSDVWKLAEQAQEKRAILGAVSNIKTAEAMEFAAGPLKSPDLSAEAALAALHIARSIYAREPQAAAAAMKQIVNEPVADELKKQAQEILLEIESVRSYLTQWEVAGPYEQEGKNYAQLFDTPFAPEKPDDTVPWKSMPISRLDNHPAYLDLLKELNGGEQCVAYLRTTVESEREKPARLEIYSDDGVKAWLNGILVHSNNTARPIMPEPDIVNVTLKKGSNKLMLKITQNNLPWGAIVRLQEAPAAATPEPKLGEGFKLHVINAESRFEAGTIMDVNNDGKPDILSGGFWYQAPTWEKHVVREIQEEGGYYYDFANLPMDVNGDGWMDTGGAAWHNKMVYWVRNPGQANGPWQVFEVDTPGNMETAIAVDINGDGQDDILPNIMSAAAWYEYKRDASAPQGV